jgi:hypothetical protein
VGDEDADELQSVRSSKLGWTSSPVLAHGGEGDVSPVTRESMDVERKWMQRTDT